LFVEEICAEYILRMTASRDFAELIFADARNLVKSNNLKEQIYGIISFFM